MPRRNPLQRVVIIGGGVAGLAAAHALERLRREQGAAIETLLLEASPRVGGNIRTEHADGFVLDAGPDGFLAAKPQGAALCTALGLESELVAPLPGARKVYVAHRGGLVPLPEGVMLAAPSRLAPILATPLLSLMAKLRMGADLVLPAKRGSADESMHAFVERRLGREAAELFADTLMAGIHAGDARQLSIRATFPQLVAMEARHGGLIRAARAAPRPSGHAFLSLRAGMGDMIRRLEEFLGERVVRTATPVREIVRNGRGGFTVVTEPGETMPADAVLLCVPPHIAAPLLVGLDPRAAELLASVRAFSSATAFFGLPRASVAHPLDAAGFVVPRRERLPFTAGTFVTSKWPGRAAPQSVLLRVFLGGAFGEDALNRPDADLLAESFGALRTLLGIQGDASLMRIFRHKRASLQLEIGHLERIAEVNARMQTLGTVRLASGGVDGVGIPDCIRQGEAAARSLAAAVAHVREESAAVSP